MRDHAESGRLHTAHGCTLWPTGSTPPTTFASSTAFATTARPSSSSHPEREASCCCSSSWRSTCSGLLGVFPDLPIETNHTILQPGDALILYTDGVADELDPYDGSPSLADLIRSCAGASAQEIGDCVMLAAAEATTETKDDRAVLVIRAGDGDCPAENRNTSTTGATSSDPTENTPTSKRKPSGSTTRVLQVALT